MIEIKNAQSKERILSIYPPCIPRADDYDIDFWTYLLSFAHQFNVSIKQQNNENIDKRIESAQRFFIMLSRNFYSEPKLSLEWDC